MSINIEDNQEEDKYNNDEIQKLNDSENSKENLDENKNYIKIVFLKNMKINILLIIIFIFLFILEFFFRKPLFDFSKSFEKKWQEKSSNSTISFFKIITKVGGEYLMGAPIAFVLCFFQIIKSSFFIAGLIFVLHFHSLMKIWYGNKRPFWEDVTLFKGICDGGFGNPSGHSISSVYLYTTLFVYLIQTKMIEKKIIIKILLFIFFSTFVLLVILSRLILGIHSINQVIYGAVLGLFTSLLVVQILKLHKMPILFYKRLFKEKIVVFCISSILLILEILSILSSISFNINFDYDYYDKILEQLCEELPKYRKFNLDGLFGAFVVLALLGMYLGQVVFWYLIDNFYKKNNNKATIQKMDSIKSSEEVNDIEKDDYDEKKNNKRLDELIIHWNENRSFINCSIIKILKIFSILMICCCPLALFILVSREANIIVIFIFKFGIPFFFSLFLIFSLGFYYIIKIICGEKEDLLLRINENIIDTNII